MMPVAPSSILGAAQHRSLSWSRRDVSRLTDDYEILRQLGRGAFGSVYLVRHKLDGNLYALKQILLKNEDRSVVMREVEVLSRIHNDHVVRYYGAWVERGRSENLPTDTLNLHTCTSEKDITAGSFSPLDDGCFGHGPTCHLCQTEYKDWEVSFEEWGLIDSVLQPLDLCTECYLQSLPKSYDKSHMCIRETQPQSENLFILMEYCGQTLVDAANDVQVDDETLWSFVLQCLKGLMYLHDKNIMHRDIKPTNIFVRDGVVKIGDLGLALQTTMGQGNLNRKENDSSHSVESWAAEPSKSTLVGTYLYTAPEVGSGKYNERCDIFSLGVVVVEIFGRYCTAMERADTLGKLRQSGKIQFPPNGSHRQQLVINLAQRMIEKNPVDRPSAKEIWDEVSDQDTTTRSSEQIVRLKMELEHKNNIIESMRCLLDKHGISHIHIQNDTKPGGGR